MDANQTETAIGKALKTALGHSGFELTDSTHLVDDEILDSLDASVFLLELEKESGRKISDQEVDHHNLFVVGNLKKWLLA